MAGESRKPVPSARSTGVTPDSEGDFIDVFLILFTSVAMTFVIFFLASRVARAPIFEGLPDWLTGAFGQVWAVVTASAVGLGAAIYRSVSRRGKSATSVFQSVGIITLILVVVPVLLAYAIRGFQPSDDDHVRLQPGKEESDGKPEETKQAEPARVGKFRALPSYLTGKEPGIPDTRKAFDFNKDGVEDDCRIVDSGKWYFLCTSTEGANWDEISEPTLTGYNGAWLDWNKDGFMDWCHITGTEDARYVKCNFTNGQKIEGTLLASGTQ